MSTYLHLDSTWRNNGTPTEFLVSSSVSENWNTSARTVLAIKPHETDKYVANLVHTIKIASITLPYTYGPTNSSIIIDQYPYLYVGLKSNKYSDNYLINTIEKTKNNNSGISAPQLRDAVFVITYDKTQGSTVPPNWVQYKCCMNQTYRYDPKDALYFRIFTNDGKTLDIRDSSGNINPLRQVNAVFEVTPYVRDAKHDNHFLTFNTPEH
jgi:hypothetical protein